MSRYANARFLLGAWQPGQFPPDEGSEVAFAGRSNSGKSSAINAITGRTSLARTSKTPGRTQLINFFELDAGRRLVDLPGYGFAKVPPKMQQHWRTLMTGYFETRSSLTGLVIVMDARRPLTDFDWQMLDWVQARALSALLLLTKADKLSRSEALRTLARVTAETRHLATTQLFSATAKSGVPEARSAVDRMLSPAPDVATV